MEFSGPSITEMQGMLLAMQKNLECPICLEVMKEPVSTKCAHIFCRFCVFKLLSQKKGVTQCPLCNAKVTKRSLWEDVRFKQVIEGVLKTICAFEHDTGLKFADDQCFPKRAIETVSSSVPRKNKSIIDSKGYRNRLKSVKERKKENTTLENSSSPLANGSVTRHSLKKKRNSSKAFVFEIGSDSSEDLIKKAGAVECVGFGSGSLSQDSDGCAEKQSPSLCHMKLSEPTTEDVAPLDILGACDLLEEGLGSTEVIQVNTGNSEVVEENVAVEKNQRLSFPDSCMQQHGKKSNSIQENGSCSLLSREQLVCEDTKPTTDAGHGTEMIGVVLSAGSAQICSIPPEDNDQLLQPQSPPDSPLSQVSGKRLRRSIQKVNEWLSKSKGIPSSRPMQDAQTEELVQDLDPYLLDADSCISQKTEQVKDLGEFIVECENERCLSKPVASKIEDKIFGRTYKRERRSTPLRNEKETIQVPTEEEIATNIKSCDTPIRKILMRKRKATSELTPEDFIKRQDMKENSKRPAGDEDTFLEEGGHTSPLDRCSVAKQKKAILPAESDKEGVSILKTEVGKQTRSKSLPESNLCDSKNLKKKTNSLSRRSRLTMSQVDAKEPGASVYHQGNAELQIDSYPSSEEPKNVVAGQVHVRRSKRLQLWTEEACRRSEPAKRGRKVDERGKGEKQRGFQEIKTLSFPSTAEDDPILLQGRLQKGMSCSEASLMGIEDNVSKACTNPVIPPAALEVVESSPSVKQRIKGCGPCYTVANMNSQGICSLPQFQPKVEQSTFEGKQFTTTPQPEKSGLCPKVPESDEFYIGDVTESCKTPKAGGKAAGTLELNPETDDSELDTGFVQKIFSRCTRQSFLLHPSPVKESAAEIQRKISVGWEKDGAVDCVTKSTQGIDRIYEERGEAVVCEVSKDIPVQSLVSCTSSFPEQNSGMEHLQVVSEVLSPGCPSTPVCSAAKNAQDKSQPQSRKLASEKGASAELGRETSNSSSRSPSVQSKTDFQDIHLNSLNETNASTVRFQGTGPEGAENKMLPFSSQPDLMHLHPESCQLTPPELSCIHPEKKNSTMEQAPDSCSPGVPKCLASGENVEQSFDVEFHNFPLLLETPKSVHDSAVKGKKGSSNLWGMGRKDILAVFVKTAEQTLHGRDLDSSNSSKSSKCKGLVRSRRRLVQKLPSSEEEDSSEDEELPCFQALISGQLESTPLQLMKEEMSALSSNSRSNPKSEEEGASPSQQSGCSVNLFSSQSHASEDNSPKRCDSKFITPTPTSKEKLASPSRKNNTTHPRGRISRDDGHQEHVNAEPNLGEETMDYDSEASHPEDSSGLSSQSETLTTQQKEFMQNNLKKLQQKMAILEAVLKEGSQSTSPKELLPTCKEDDFPLRQIIAASGVTLVMEANSENLKTSNLKEDLPEEVPATPDHAVSSKNLEPVVQKLQSAGSTVKLRSGSKQNLLGDFSPGANEQGIPNGSSAASSRSKGHTSICLAKGTARKSPHGMQDTDRLSAARQKAQEEPDSFLAPIVCCNAGNGKLKSSLLTCKRNMFLVASGLSPGELRLVQKFAKKTGSTWSNQLTEETTHVVMKTDVDLVCERTLKYFLGIAAQKWVVSYHWIIQSLKKGSVLNEVDFEVKGDVVNGRSHEGPKRARESPAGKLFQGLEICCYGPFTDMLSEQLEWMVVLCGASLVKQPHLFARATKSDAVVVVQPDAWVEVAACQEILLQCGATVVAREWVLDSIACYQRQMFEKYMVQLM
ncbi:breast cancer type 1 susceptibility protein [Tiliqua scincoides]|uniref:breast cancer type 1 susceptibility protein n=1 Tax=Tiliqua scincoides TaxID=71010 RepID=UPI0034637C8B